MNDRNFGAVRIARRAALMLFPAALLALSPLAAAQAKYPDKPIRLILPFGPGGVADVTARIVADKLSQKLGEQVVIENMPGPGGINAARTVVRAPADGYTLGLLSNGTAISVDMFEHLPFDPLKQFAMVSEIGSFDLVLAVSAQSKYKTLQDLIAAAKANPGKLNLGTIAVGSTQNLGAELFKSMSGTNMVIVPYKNSPDIVVALLRGDVDATLEFTPAVEGQVKDGKLRILASSGLKRSPFLKEVPTVAESGVPGYDVSSWNGVFAPKGTPKDVIDTLNKAIGEVVAMPDVKAKFATLGVVAEASTPDELMARMKADIAKWDAVIKKAGIPKK
jgi:tripartite-type tricarboxylate transporter receptor subunit TctC